MKSEVLILMLFTCKIKSCNKNIKHNIIFTLELSVSAITVTQIVNTTHNYTDNANK